MLHPRKPMNCYVTRFKSKPNASTQTTSLPTDVIKHIKAGVDEYVGQAGGWDQLMSKHDLDQTELEGGKVRFAWDIFWSAKMKGFIDYDRVYPYKERYVTTCLLKLVPNLIA